MAKIIFSNLWKTMCLITTHGFLIPEKGHTSVRTVRVQCFHISRSHSMSPGLWQTWNPEASNQQGPASSTAPREPSRLEQLGTLTLQEHPGQRKPYCWATDELVKHHCLSHSCSGDHPSTRAAGEATLKGNQMKKTPVLDNENLQQSPGNLEGHMGLSSYANTQGRFEGFLISLLWLGWGIHTNRKWWQTQHLQGF